MENKKLTKVINAMRHKNILKSVVKSVYFDKGLNEPVLLLQTKGVKSIIPLSEVDLRQKLKSLTGFIGREVYYVVLSVDEEKEIAICSRKKAQQVLEDKTLLKMKQGGVFTGQIVNLLQHGAYIEVEGLVGFLKNKDFSEDFTFIKEIYKQGDKIQVIYKDISDSGKVFFTVPQKYVNKKKDLRGYEKGHIVLGYVKQIEPWGCFVNIDAGVDVLCPVPLNIEIEENTKVNVKISKVDYEKKRIRGKIVKAY